MRTVIRVALLSLAVWESDLARMSGAPRPRVRLLATISALAIIVSGAVLAITTTSAVDGSAGPDVIALILRTALSGSFLTSALIALVLTLTAPESTALDNLFALMPVRAGSIRLGKLVPLLGASFLCTGALALPTISLAWKLLPSPSAALLTAAFGMATVAIQVLVQCVLHAAASALVAFRFHELVATTISGALVLGVALVLYGRGIVEPRLPSLAFPSVDLQDAVLGIEMATSPWPWAVLVLWSGAAATVATIVMRLPRTAPTGTSIPILRSVVNLADRRKGRTLAKALLLLRAPQTLLGLLGMTIAFVAGMLAPPTLLPPLLGHSLVSSAPVAAFTFVLFGPGRSLAWSWVGSSSTARDRWWVAPMVVAHLAVAVTVMFPLIAVALWTGMISTGDLGDLLARASILFATSLITGALVPVSQEQPLSGSIALVLAVLLYLVVVQSIGWLTSTVEEAAVPTATFAAAVLLALFAALPLRNLRAL